MLYLPPTGWIAKHSINLLLLQLPLTLEPIVAPPIKMFAHPRCNSGLELLENNSLYFNPALK